MSYYTIYKPISTGLIPHDEEKPLSNTTQQANDHLLLSSYQEDTNHLNATSLAVRNTTCQPPHLETSQNNPQPYQTNTNITSINAVNRPYMDDDTVIENDATLVDYVSVLCDSYGLPIPPRSDNKPLPISTPNASTMPESVPPSSQSEVDAILYDLKSHTIFYPENTSMPPIPESDHPSSFQSGLHTKSHNLKPCTIPNPIYNTSMPPMPESGHPPSFQSGFYPSLQNNNSFTISNPANTGIPRFALPSYPSKFHTTQRNKQTFAEPSPKPPLKPNIDDNTNTNANITLNLKKKKERPHICLICNKSYTRKSGLMHHMDAHMNNSTYRCPDKTCLKTTKTLASLKTHVQLIHPTLKVSFKHCRLCRTVLFNDVHYVKHMQKKHPNSSIHTPTAFPCPICFKILKYFHSLQSHLRTHDKNITKVKCPFCNKPYRHACSLGRHLKKCPKKNNRKKETQF